MIGYATLGTNDLPRAAKFYDALLGTIGAKRWMESEKFVVWTVSPTTPGLGVITPHNGKPATVGNGMMVALAVESRAKVDELYAKALALGGKDEGKPGSRGEMSPGQEFYGAYFRDLEGNKLCAFKIGPKA